MNDPYSLEIEFLGTGTSTGVPVIKCDCPVCQSTDPRDNRLRTSAIVRYKGKSILIDCGPDFRTQILRASSDVIDALLLTHIHYDHVGGLDDLRSYCYNGNFPIFARQDVIDNLHARLPYCFAEHPYPGVPRLKLVETAPGDRFTVGDIPVTALEVMHGKLPILAFRIGDLGYVTDMKTATEEQLCVLRGVKLLVINGLRHRPHHSHQTIEQASRVARRIGNQPTYLIHMCHDIGLYDYEESWLPEGIHLAYDGMTFEI